MEQKLTLLTELLFFKAEKGQYNLSVELCKMTAGWLS